MKEMNAVELAELEEMLEDLVSTGDVTLAVRLAQRTGFPLDRIWHPEDDGLECEPDWPRSST